MKRCRRTSSQGYGLGRFGAGNTSRANRQGRECGHGAGHFRFVSRGGQWEVGETGGVDDPTMIETRDWAVQKTSKRAIKTRTNFSHAYQ